MRSRAPDAFAQALDDVDDDVDGHTAELRERLLPELRVGAAS
ncbi:hypothetical protein [Isoptericola sp. BMS4]|nr:hypothetical protein [Isoptericola sp. BMS4]